MTKSLENLQLMVADLEEELRRINRDSPEAQELLKRLADDVQAALDAQRAAQPDGAQPDAAAPTERLQNLEKSVLQQLQASAQDFESSHPNVARLFNQIVEMLGHMGI